ncbi:MAG: carbon-nitrogen hydrolase [Leptospiraceae bacterium]|nr:MAG: carbon-nitrogen hydrolase [Leptospiraceae bacterium]
MGQAETLNKNSKTYKIELRNLKLEDYNELKELMNKCYKGSGPGNAPWTKEQIKTLLNKFPEGQIVITVNKKIVACALSIIVNYKYFGDEHTYRQITGNYTFSTHDPNGDVLYGIDVFVDPEYQGMRLGRRLYEARKELCENLNLRSIMVGGRIPNYYKYAKELTPKQYIEKVKSKEIYDPVLSFQLANDFYVRRILKNYLRGDVESKEYAILLEWPNIYYNPEKKLFNRLKSVVRVGLVQWQMRNFDELETLLEQVEFFVDAISDYGSDFILFPEFFNAPLMQKFNHLEKHEAIRRLADYTIPLRDAFIDFAVSYNINIIAGSMPIVEKGKLYNISFLCRRDGSFDSYKKIHITPDERSSWGLEGGNELKVFDTDCGKIGILICYDVEFPELARILADQGMQILFVPFLTDTQNSYNRVRLCAQARAVENECYVAIAGSVGNLPKVENMDIQFAQSAVFTPSDIAFPTNAIKGETTPNTEMTLIVDLDLDLLKELHIHGTVTNLLDRRKDLYKIQWLKK